MKLQDQRIIEALKAQMPEHAEEYKEKNCTHQPYRTPEVLLVGKAKRLVAGSPSGINYDSRHHYYSTFDVVAHY